MSIGGVNHEAIAAIENACLDVKGKALGVPVYAYSRAGSATASTSIGRTAAASGVAQGLL